MPFRLDLEYQRKRAKELAKAVRAGEPAALGRFRKRHPRAAGLADAALVARLGRLSEAQLVVARELGLPSWPKLKAHVQAMRDARMHLARGGAAPDGDAATLHVRCGSDLLPALREAGFAGDYLEYSDMLCQGPVLDEPDWLERRADFLSVVYGGWVGRDRSRIAAGLAAAEADLHRAAAAYARVVLWFEHDTYDQLVLARCLAAFEAAPPARLELISLDRFPGSTRFVGLGQLPPEALLLLWRGRMPVSPAQRAAGRAAWERLRAPDPRPLAASAAGWPGALPHLAGALLRHCREFPGARDGLGLSERLVLQLLAEAPRTAGEIYRDLMLEREPLPWMSDLMMRALIEGMKRARPKPFECTAANLPDDWAKEPLALAPAGRAVLAGDVDWLSLAPPERWLGGVRIAAATPCWRWDEASAGFVLR